MTTTTDSARTAPTATRWARFGRELSYLLTGFPIGVAAFTVVLTGLCIGVSAVPVFLLGVPVLVATLAVARWFAAVEHRRVQTVLGRPLARHVHQTQDTDGLSGWIGALRDAQSWRDVLHALLALVVSTVTFSIALTWTLGGLGELLYGAWSWSLPDSPDNHGLVDLIFGVTSRAAEIAFNTGIGVVLVGTALPVVHGLAVAQAALGHGLLTSSRAALEARAQQLAAGRRGAVAAEEQARRRLERDLHDGPQQRLVRMTMDLETVARRLEDDPDRAKPLVSEVIAQSRAALDELRALSRGIAPPVLADRGLVAALTAISGLSPIPVALESDLPDGARFSPVVENTAYYVASEALTNAAKHSGAGTCVVRVGADGSTLDLRVCDDGNGGAHPGKGHGLAGLLDRLATVEGTLTVTSPPGGPTEIAARIPLRGLDE